MAIWNPWKWVTSRTRKAQREPIAIDIEKGLPSDPDPQHTTQGNPLYFYLGGGRGFRKILTQNDIISVRQDCWEMYVNDGDVAAQLDGIGIDANATDDQGLPFALDPKIQADTPFVQDPDTLRRQSTPEQEAINEVFDEARVMMEDLGLYDRLAPASTMAVCQGEHFEEVIWDKRRGSYRPVALEPIPGIREGAVMMELLDPARGNAVVGWGLYDVLSGDLIREPFLPWQVMHFKWNNNLPLFTSVRLQYKMLKESEEDLYVGRHSRAYPRIGRTIEGASHQELLEFIKKEEQIKREYPPGPDSDIIANTAIQLLDPKNTGLQVADLEYRRRIMQSAGRKPIGELAAYGHDINRATLDKQDETYVRMLTRVNSMEARPIRKLIRVFMVLAGRDPADFPYALSWTDKNPDEFQSKVQGLAILRDKFGLSQATGLREAGYDLEEELDKNEYEAAVGRQMGDPGEEFMDRVTKEIMSRRDKNGNGNDPEAEARRDLSRTR